MIFVTVGTHEQQFNRILEKIDQLIGEGLINEEVIIQSGFSTYKVKNCRCESIISYSEMINNIKAARIVITHGGPATFIMPLKYGKIPIVVPRQKQFDEHVNDHQIEFAKKVKNRHNNIILVEEIDELSKVLKEYDKLIQSMSIGVKSNNEKFNNDFNKLVNEIMAK